MEREGHRGKYDDEAGRVGEDGVNEGQRDASLFGAVFMAGALTKDEPGEEEVIGNEDGCIDGRGARGCKRSQKVAGDTTDNECEEVGTLKAGKGG
jgi:hypothetical protein